MSMSIRCCAAWLLAAVCVPAHATFSIAACDAGGDCGVAVATHNLAVGASVPWARAGVGALASQFETRLAHGPRGLDLLASGRSPAQALRTLLDEDAGDEDGGIAERQVGLVDARGRNAQYTGATAARSHWAGASGDGGTSVQGNGLAGPEVLEAMHVAFAATEGPLAGRLLAALDAGQLAGGQRGGQLSAALLVRTRAGGWNDVDLRVDADVDAVARLGRLYRMRLSRSAVARAERLYAAGHADAGRRAVSEALALADGWDRTWARAARLAMREGDTALARDCLGVLHGLNPTLAGIELGAPLFAPLRDDPLVASWRQRKEPPIEPPPAGIRPGIRCSGADRACGSGRMSR